MKHYIETKRLILRNWKDEDVALFQSMNASPEVRRYFPDILSYRATENMIDQMKSVIDQHEIGLFAVELKETKSFIGMVGLNYIPEGSELSFPELPFYEIGWRMDKDVWGNGLATEAAEAVLTYAKSKGIDEVYSFTSEINKPSRRVMEKLEMNHIRNFLHPKVIYDDDLAAHVLYHKVL
ncbi:GNAT family N-acetyltransferase [Mammaliicoccus sciuri]|uniref:N-acetyltransferase n=1 Tax=Mammaliicoccus sciuri TaxID=1296 RepID=A0AAI8GUB5_MAMSC|nr:GNAT family N-acetyltransferase [Mammaliicoccus sciuri]OOV36943.1 GNAT family N-acetyltransferase [Staphylococcus sp. MB371]ASE34915.1 N-acetyltransferase [Mammaliicoccus sciuri]KTT86095.1 acetyltransferase [Mammaliicoccus sciuri]KTT89082.1 acetyltransferase [Mammaliicoccus sciuri]KTT92067.1 acetyltransferase [Mammaliicoccus sciuri]